jgi:hypothetical protein
LLMLKPRCRPRLKSESVAGRKRVDAYSDLEEPICDCVNMGMAAVEFVYAGERELAEFMLHQLKPLLQDLRKRYFAKGFAK